MEQDEMKHKRVCVVGLGYIGLPTAAVLAQAGHEVVGVDQSTRRIQMVNAGVVPFAETGLDEVLSDVVASGRLKAQQESGEADCYIVAVPTPLLPDQRVDLTYIDAAIKSLAPHLADGNLLILESTAPPGTTARMAETVLAMRPDLSLDGAGGRGIIHFAHAPERVLPGRIMVELVYNDRIIGGLTPTAGILAKELYASFCAGELLLTDTATAEMAKLTENAFRDVNIAFANELSVICERLGIDVWELIHLANHHPRVSILQPGPGVGGHCIAVDPWFIVGAAPEEARLIRTAREVNDNKPRFVRETIRRAMDGLDHREIAILGLAFKANVNDLRESPSVEIARNLAEDFPSTEILTVEPNIEKLPDSLSLKSNITLVTLEEAVCRATVLVLLVDHKEFALFDQKQLRDKVIVDTKGLWRGLAHFGNCGNNGRSNSQVLAPGMHKWGDLEPFDSARSSSITAPGYVGETR